MRTALAGESREPSILYCFSAGGSLQPSGPVAARHAVAAFAFVLEDGTRSRRVGDAFTFTNDDRANAVVRREFVASAGIRVLRFDDLSAERRKMLGAWKAQHETILHYLARAGGDGSTRALKSRYRDVRVESKVRGLSGKVELALGSVAG